MNSMYKWEFTLRFTELHLIMAFSVAVHIALFSIVLPKSHFQLSEQEKMARLKKLDDKDDAEELSIEERLKRQNKTETYGIVYIGDQTLYRKRLLDNFLDETFSKKASLSEKTTPFSGLAARSNDAVKNAISIELSDSEKKSYAYKLLKKHSHVYKQCYIKFQKMDHLLEGIVDLRIKATRSRLLSKASFSGVGQRDIIKKLESCVETKLALISFPEQLAGNTYKLTVKF